MASISPICKKCKNFISALKSTTYIDFMIKKSLTSKTSKSHTWAPLKSCYVRKVETRHSSRVIKFRNVLVHHEKFIASCILSTNLECATSTIYNFLDGNLATRTVSGTWNVFCFLNCICCLDLSANWIVSAT